jgi:hypothetical protein
MIQSTNIIPKQPSFWTKGNIITAALLGVGAISLIAYGALRMTSIPNVTTLVETSRSNSSVAAAIDPKTVLQRSSQSVTALLSLFPRASFFAPPTSPQPFSFAQITPSLDDQFHSGTLATVDRSRDRIISSWRP